MYNYYYKYDNTYTGYFNRDCIENNLNRSYIMKTVDSKPKVVKASDLRLMNSADTNILTLKYSNQRQPHGWIPESRVGSIKTLQYYIDQADTKKYNTINLEIQGTQTVDKGAVDMSINNKGPYKINYNGTQFITTAQNISISGDSRVDISGFKFKNISGEIFNITNSNVSLTNIDISGGVIDKYLSYGPPIISYKIVSPNPLFNSDISDGGDITLPTLSLTNISIKNVLYGSMGIIELNNAKKVDIKGLYILDCSGKDGPRSGSINSIGDISFIDASMTFIRNRGAQFGSAINVSGNLSIIGGNYVFKNNKAKFNGGAISANNIFITRTNQLIFNGNLTDVSNQYSTQRASGGGAIYSPGNITIAHISSIDFINNYSINNGGAIFSESTIHFKNIDKVNFYDNSSNINGGAINATGNIIYEDISTIDFSNNYSINNGGAIFSEGTIDFNNIDNMKFYINIVESSGGGGIISSKNISISKGSHSFSNNILPQYSGGVIIASNSININDADINFINNFNKDKDAGSDIGITTYGAAINSKDSITLKDVSINFIANPDLWAIYMGSGTTIDIDTANFDFSVNRKVHNIYLGKTMKTVYSKNITSSMERNTNYKCDGGDDCSDKLCGNFDTRYIGHPYCPSNTSIV